jgi:hypothetical protein
MQDKLYQWCFMWYALLLPRVSGTLFNLIPSLMFLSRLTSRRKGSTLEMAFEIAHVLLVECDKHLSRSLGPRHQRASCQRNTKGRLPWKQ